MIRLAIIAGVLTGAVFLVIELRAFRLERHVDHQALADAPELPARACRVCGCTDDEACASACWWVTPNLCSSCHDDMADAWSTPGSRP